MTRLRQTHSPAIYDREKEQLLEILSKKLGCPTEDVSFLFQAKTAPAAPLELTIPDERSMP